MPTRERLCTIGTQRGESLIRTIGREVRDMRLRAGLTQAQLARAAGVARTFLSRLERGRLHRLDIGRAAVLAAVLGHRMSVKTYPVGQPVRDEGQRRLLDDFDARLPPSWRRRRESVMPIAGDLRAWDERLDGPVSIGIDAETVLRDLQATERAMTAKQRDSGVMRIIVLIRGSHRNRALLRSHLVSLRQTFPLDTREVLTALAAGRDPGGNGIVVI